MATLSDPLDFKAVTNLFLYGTVDTPVNYSDRIRDPAAPVVSAQIDAATFMSATGPGQYALPYFASFVRDFFEDIGALPGPVQTYLTQPLAQQNGQWPVSVSVATLKTLIGTEPFKIIFQQRGWDSGSSDYGDRTYIYNTEMFNISDSTVFVFDPFGTDSHIENMQIIPAPDGFDFQSNSPLAQLGNDNVLKPNIDPYNLSLGRELALQFTNLGGVPVIENYNSASYNADKEMVDTRLLELICHRIQERRKRPLFQHAADHSESA